MEFYSADIEMFMSGWNTLHVEKINSTQMEMDLWTGIATFDRLSLFESALLSRDGPFKVKRGAIKHI
jgi:hypothetical protein